ncbi:amino acid ABC transporter substrate-binding protein [Thiofilum flexile]|uniref:amino acid ABC transporter substrate-binding protein n=1 Tax=Thiofilum flexile TaxID=125627 RepID=UPI00037BCF25|nr:amino acid ABC transporter substrate-binding protein [Thiofilum flexile]
MKTTKLLAIASTVVVAVSMMASAHAGGTLDGVKKKGFIQCGINSGVPGFSIANDKGEWSGLDVDFCKAVAAAVFGDTTKVKYTSLTAKERFTALQSGEIDLLSRNTTWTLTRDSNLGISFTGVNYYDGQGFLVNNGVKSAKELDGASVCIQAGTTTELNLSDYFRANNMKYEPITYDKVEETIKGFEEGRCDVLTSDQSQLYALRLQLKEPEKAEVLPEVISKEPLGPSVRQGDEDWFKIVRWTLFAMVEAEELGLTSANIDEKKSSADPSVKRFVGAEEGVGGQGLKLGNEWAYNIVKQVGNYGESFERNVGSGSPLKIERGLNALWSKGGLQYAAPIR